MARVTVFGAGVVGSVYGALLAGAGHDVTLVARGRRLEQLRALGLRVVLDGELLEPTVNLAEEMPDDVGDALLVCIRGDQLASALDAIADANASTVMVFANPLRLREMVMRRIGPARLVWCFSGVGGGAHDGSVVASRVPQQPTVVQLGVPASPSAERLLAGVDRRLRREPHMEAWLDTHSVFVAAMAAVLLLERPRTRRRRRQCARLLVEVMREAFAALEESGTTITPGNLRAIFGWVPLVFATAYWSAQFRRPVVTVAMAEHAAVTRDTEQRAVARHALSLVGTDARRYRALVERLA